MKAALTAALVAVPQLAWACPYCAGTNRGGYAVAVLLGVLIAVPYTIVYIVQRVVRNADHADERNLIDR